MLSSSLKGALTSQTQGTHQKSLKANLALETRSTCCLLVTILSVIFLSPCGRSLVQSFFAFRLMISLAELQ